MLFFVPYGFTTVAVQEVHNLRPTTHTQDSLTERGPQLFQGVARSVFLTRRRFQLANLVKDFGNLFVRERVESFARVQLAPLLCFVGRFYGFFGFLELVFKFLLQVVNPAIVNRQALGLHTGESVHTFHKEAERLFKTNHLCGLNVTQRERINGVKTAIVDNVAFGDTHALFEQVKGVAALCVFPVHNRRNEMVRFVVVADNAQFTVGVEFQPNLLGVV